LKKVKKKKVKKLPMMNTVAYNKVLKGYNAAVYKEFQREKKATLKWLASSGILSKLEAESRKRWPEAWEDVTEKVFDRDALKTTLYDKVLTKEEIAFVDKYIKGWSDNVKPEKMEKVFEKWNPIAGEMAGNQALESLGLSLAFNLKDPAMLAELAKRGTKITGGITKKTLKDFQKILVDSYYEQGVSPYAVRGKITGLFEDTYKNRAMFIARTETGVASSTTQFATYKNNRIGRKKWLALVDDRTRDSHEQVNGVEIGIDDYFIVGGHEMLHPHDDGAPAQEVINCRCDMLAVFTPSQLPKEGNVWVGEKI